MKRRADERAARPRRAPRQERPSSRREEWDWPPRQRARRAEAPVLEGRIVRGRVEFVPPYGRTGWNSPGVSKAIHIYSRIIVGIVKFLVAIPMSLMIFGAMWLMWVLLTGP